MPRAHLEDDEYFSMCEVLNKGYITNKELRFAIIMQSPDLKNEDHLQNDVSS